MREARPGARAGTRATRPRQAPHGAGGGAGRARAAGGRARDPADAAHGAPARPRRPDQPAGRRIEEGEAPVEAALREAEEEIGLPPDRVGLLGELPPYRTGTGFCIHPVVGWVDPPERFRLDPFEVAELFEVPLSFILDPANHRRDSYERNGKTRQFYVLPYEGRYIWGATAGILVGLSRILRD